MVVVRASTESVVVKTMVRRLRHLGAKRHLAIRLAAVKPVINLLSVADMRARGDKAMHEHYPYNPEQAQELYEDLIDYSGLTHEQALETVGYAASRELWSCDIAGPLWKMLMVGEWYHAYPIKLDPTSSVDK